MSGAELRVRCWIRQKSRIAAELRATGKVEDAVKLERLVDEAYETIQEAKARESYERPIKRTNTPAH